MELSLEDLYRLAETARKSGARNFSSVSLPLLAEFRNEIARP